MEVSYEKNFCSPIIIAPKTGVYKDEPGMPMELVGQPKRRVCFDGRGLGEHILEETLELPTFNDMLEAAGSGKVLGTLDQRSAYDSCGISKGLRPYTTFRLPPRSKYANMSFQWTVHHFGLKVSGNVHNFAMKRIMAELPFHYQKKILLFVDFPREVLLY